MWLRFSVSDVKLFLFYMAVMQICKIMNGLWGKKGEN